MYLKEFYVNYIKIILYIWNTFKPVLKGSAIFNDNIPGHEAQSVTCLAADTCLTADPGVVVSYK